MDGGVDERLHDEEDVGRAGAGDRGRHRDHLLVVDLELVAERAEQRRRLGALRRRSSRASRTRRSCPCRGGPACWACSGRPGRGRGCPSGRRSSRRPGPIRTSWPRRRCGPISRPTLASIWGLIPSRITSAPSTASTLRGDRPDAVLALEVLAALRARMAGDDLVGLDQLAAEHAGDHRLGHDAGADGRDRGLRQGGHRAEYSRGRRGGPGVARCGSSLVAGAPRPVRKNRPVVVDAGIREAGARRAPPRARAGS